MAGAQKLTGVKFEDMIRRHGRKVRWEEAVTCSCVNMDSGHANYECNACNGKGYTLAEPVEDLVLFNSIVHNKQFEEMAGVFEVGDAVMSVGKHVPVPNPVTGRMDLMGVGRPNPIYHVGMYDLITLTDDEYKTSEVLVKGEAIYARPADTLLNEDVVDVLSVRQSNPITGEVKVYTKDEDYTWESNVIIWQGVNVPMDGEQYTVQYTHRPVFTVFTNLPTPRHQDGQDLPKRVAVRYRAGGFERQ